MAHLDIKTILACHDVLARYAMGADWADMALFADVFWDDATIDFGAFACGKAEFVAMIGRYPETHERRWHHFGIPSLSGNTNSVRAEFTSHAILRDRISHVDQEAMGRYIVRLLCIADAWRISELTYLVHRSTELALTAQSNPGLREAQDLSPNHALAARHAQ